MNKCFLHFTALTLLILSMGISGKAQFVLNGGAVSLGGDCYRLTQPIGNQLGTAWSSSLISLNDSFDLQFDIYLGCLDANGADGMVFGLQPVSTSAGNPGQGMGFGGIVPSLGVEFDTWQNTTLADPTYDHMAIVQNGNVDHNTANTLAGPVQIVANQNNVEDCQYHRIRITWSPNTFEMKVWFDCDLRMAHTFATDPVQSIFSGNPMVHWGFTAATGGAVNEHRFCLINSTFVSNNQAADVCKGDSVQLTFSGGVSYVWDNAATLSNDTIANPFFKPDSTTNYIVTITDSCGNIWSDTATITVFDIPEPHLGGDTLMCSNTIVQLDAAVSDPLASYLWSNGDTSSAITPSATQNYRVTVTDTSGVCSKSDTVYVAIIDPPIVDLGPDTFLCPGNQLVYQAYNDSANYLWQDGSVLPTYIANQPASSVSIQVTNPCGSAMDSVYIDSIPSISVNLGNDTNLCVGNGLVLDAFQNHPVSYSWSTGAGSSSIPATADTSYSVTVSNTCFSVADTFNLLLTPPPVIDLGNDTSLCLGDSITLNAAFDTSSYIWSNGSTQSELTIGSAGTYSVTVTNFCGLTTDQITLQNLTIPVAAIDSLRIICPGEVAVFNGATPGATTYLWSNGSALPTASSDTSETLILTVQNSCGSTSDTATVIERPEAQLVLPADTLICEGSSFQLSPEVATTGQLSWNTGLQGESISISNAGIYIGQLQDECMVVWDTMVVTSIPLPLVSLGADSGTCRDVLVPLAVTSQPGYSYLWSTGETSPLINVSFGTYAVEVTDSIGCSASDTLVIFPNCPFTLFVPNSFSPNNDGINDTWSAVGSNLYDFSCLIFDRWGNLQFESTVLSASWDGKNAPQGIYVCRIAFKDSAGNKHERFGTIHVITRH